MPKDKSKTSPGSIPIRTSYVCAYVFKRTSRGPRFLILKRKSSYMFGLWQQVAGKVEKGETGAATALREIVEETGCHPHALYSADIVETFYDIGHACIHIVPVFVAEFPSRAKVVISSEHSEYKWVSAAGAKRHLCFSQQRLSIDIIYHEFIEKEPRANLKIEY
jgi:dihydroneopterin triphosphate diphosphatase